MFLELLLVSIIDPDFIVVIVDISQHVPTTGLYAFDGRVCGQVPTHVWSADLEHALLLNTSPDI